MTNTLAFTYFLPLLESRSQLITRSDDSNARRLIMHCTELRVWLHQIFPRIGSQTNYIPPFSDPGSSYRIFSALLELARTAHLLCVSNTKYDKKALSGNQWYEKSCISWAATQEAEILRHLFDV